MPWSLAEREMDLGTFHLCFFFFGASGYGKEFDAFPAGVIP
jgi:hypothetical protein